MLFKHGTFLDNKKYVSTYTKKIDGKYYCGVGVDDEYPDLYYYPYDLVWRLGIENCEEVPELKYLDEEINSSIILKPYQQDCVEKLLAEPRGIFISPPGTGKTVMAIELIASLKLKTLILVNSVYLLNQWIEEIEKFTGYSAGKIGEGTFEIKDITVATFQTVRKKERLEQVRKNFSLTIVDECHRVPATTFKFVLSNIESYWKLGITGTYKRKDKLEFLADWMLSYKKTINEFDDTMQPSILIVKTGISLPPCESFVDCLNLIESDMRLLDKVEYVVGKCSEDRHHLIISFRLASVDILSLKFPEAIVVTGGTDKEGRENLNERVLDQKIIISTTLQEGVNIPNLDTLHLIHPNNNLPMLEQRIKRINRPVDGKKQPLVVDYWYKHSKGVKGFNVETQQKARLAFYKQQGYKIYVI
jgi:superfamily II DNA or RNA helicase